MINPAALRELLDSRLREEVEYFARKRLRSRQREVFLHWWEHPSQSGAERRAALGLSVSSRTVQRDLSAAFERMALALTKEQQGEVRSSVTVSRGHKTRNARDLTLEAMIGKYQDIAPK